MAQVLVQENAEDLVSQICYSYKILNLDTLEGFTTRNYLPAWI
jgi:hypothetical protein